MKQVDFYYDIVCPYAYLGATQIGQIAAAHGAEVNWRPFLLGGGGRTRTSDCPVRSRVPCPLGYVPKTRKAPVLAGRGFVGRCC